MEILKNIKLQRPFFLAGGLDAKNVHEALEAKPYAVDVSGGALEEPKAYQEHAVFYHRPSHINDLNGQNPLQPVPERQTCFQVEQVVVLCDEQFRQFQETGLKDDQIFLFDYNDKMWFDPGSLCWHCVLVKGETGKEGILVDAEGYSYALHSDRLAGLCTLFHAPFPAGTGYMDFLI